MNIFYVRKSVFCLFSGRRRDLRYFTLEGLNLRKKNMKIIVYDKNLLSLLFCCGLSGIHCLSCSLKSTPKGCNLTCQYYDVLMVGEENVISFFFSNFHFRWTDNFHPFDHREFIYLTSKKRNKPSYSLKQLVFLALRASANNSDIRADGLESI